MWPPGSCHQQVVADVTGSSPPIRPFGLDDRPRAADRNWHASS
jgi:hypothetical protein